MTMFRMPIVGHVECPDCDRLYCDVSIPRSDEPDLNNGTNYWTTYECQSCHATWTLGEAFGAFNPPASSAGRPGAVTATDAATAVGRMVVDGEAAHVGMPDPEETKGS